jgi:Peptidogalycan biosysnthesis/recognition
LRTASLRVIGQSRIDDITPVYILVKNTQGVVACLYAQVLRFRSSHFQKEDAFLKTCGKALIECFPLRLLVFGHLFRHDGSYIYFNPNIKNEAQLLVQIIDLVLEKIKHTAYFLKDMPEHLQMPFAADPSYHRFANDISMTMDIAPIWKSFQDYETSLKKKYRQRSIKTRAVFSDVEVKTLSLDEVKLEQENIYDLYKQVAKNQSVTLGNLNSAYFYEFKKQLGDELEILGYYYKGKLIAFGSAIIMDQHYDMNYIGFDYSLNQDLLLYFNMLFTFLERAIDLNCTTLILGRTALEVKAILGAKPKQVYSFYKIKNVLVNATTAFVVKRMALEQGEQWQNRHPFKEELEG